MFVPYVLKNVLLQKCIIATTVVGPIIRSFVFIDLGKFKKGCSGQHQTNETVLFGWSSFSLSYSHKLFSTRARESGVAKFNAVGHSYSEFGSLSNVQHLINPDNTQNFQELKVVLEERKHNSLTVD